MPKEVIKKLAEKGYLSASFPKEYGGLGLDPVNYGLFQEEIGKVSCAVRALITVSTSLFGETLIRCGDKYQKNKYLLLLASGEKIGAFALTEPEVGTDAKSIKTNYVKEDDMYVINGSKKWITYGDLADFFLVIAKSDEGKTSAFIVERDFDGVSTEAIEGLMAGNGTHIGKIEFKDVKVPKENLVGLEGSGFNYVTSTSLDYGRYSIAWAGVSIAEAALDAMVSYSRKRVQFDKKICNHQYIQGFIANATAKIHAARALCISAGNKRAEKSQDAIIETVMAKYIASKVAMEVATDALQVHGGNGISSDYVVERLFREAKVLEIIEGTTQVLNMVIARYSLTHH